MQFLVLGPLRIESGQPEGGLATLRVGAPKQRALLAALLVSADQMMPVDRLISELWERPPSTAVNVVRQYVSKLRTLLAPGRASGVELCTYSAGYGLTSGAADSDARRFEERVHAARQQLRQDRPAEARENIEHALGLWHGPAFCDVPDGPSVMAERARLEELRVSAQELGAEARLRSGEVAEAVSELTALRVQNPLRERVHANLMRALCADGRTADALQVYRNTRTTLQTELGVEPSTELRQLQRSILRGALEDRPDAPRT